MAYEYKGTSRPFTVPPLRLKPRAVRTEKSAVSAPMTAIAAAQKALALGAALADGSIYAGLTADGKHRICAMPEDLAVTLTFNDAAKAVGELNGKKALGHDDWQIPALETLRVLCKNQDEGALKGTFKQKAASGSGYPAWYWSSTEDRDYPSHVRNVRFSDGDECWNRKDVIRLSCRPVRLVAAAAAGFKPFLA